MPQLAPFALLASALAVIGAAPSAAPSPPSVGEVVRARVERVFQGTFASVGVPQIAGAIARVPYRLHDPQEASGTGEGINNGIALVVRYPFGWQVYRLINEACAHPRRDLTPRDIRDCDFKLRDEGRPPDVSAIRGVMERDGVLVVSSVRVVKDYAIANVGAYGVGGERALTRQNGEWIQIGGATDIVSACKLVGYGVPPPIAQRLMDRAFWPDPAPKQSRSVEACS